MAFQPAQKGGGLTKTLTIGGGIAGAFYGNPLVGASAGNMAGGLVESQKQPMQLGGSGQLAAMARMQQQRSQDNLASLKQAESSLPQLPESLRQAYSEPIIKARMLAERERGIA